MEELVRLNKYLSDSGICSRREADELIESGKVKVNGKRPEKGAKINARRDKIIVNGQEIDCKKEPVYIAFYKPEGITCTTDTSERNNIIEYVNFPERIFNIGRLDKDSEGLIFLTNDGDIVNKILRAGNNHDKEYVVTVNKPITAEFLKNMASGVPILGTMTKKCKVEKITEFTFSIILTQGLNRQIRRMCEALGYAVMKLKRVRVMNMTLKGIEMGGWRFFTESEVREMMNMIKDSDNSEKASKGAGAKTDEKIFGWQAELKMKKELKLAEAAKNPKSKTLRAGRKKTVTAASVKSGSETSGSRSKKNQESKPTTKSAGMRLEDAIKNPRIIASAKKKKEVVNTKSSQNRGKGKAAPKGGGRANGRRK